MKWSGRVGAGRCGGRRAGAGPVEPGQGKPVRGEVCMEEAGMRVEAHTDTKENLGGSAGQGVRCVWRVGATPVRDELGGSRVLSMQ